MLSMVSGSVGLLAQPARRPHLLLRADAPARGDDRRQRRGPLGQARSARRSTRSRRCCWSRACSCRSAAGPPSSRCEALRGEPVSVARAGAVAQIPPRPTRRPRLERVVAAGATGSASRCAGRPGSCCACSPPRSSSTCSCAGSSTCRLDLLVTRAAGGRSTRPRRGGFLDPLIGTVILTMIGHRASPAPLGVAHRRVADRVRAPVLARARGRVGRRDRRRDAEHRARDLRPDHLLERRVFGFLSFTAQGGAVFGRSFFTAGGDDVADRPAARRRRDARGAAGDPRPRARGVLRARQDEGGDDPPRAAARRAPGHRRPAPRSAWAASRATPRSS